MGGSLPATQMETKNNVFSLPRGAQGHILLTTACSRGHPGTTHLAKPLGGIWYHLQPHVDLGSQHSDSGELAADLHVAERSWGVAEASRIKDGVYETTVVQSVSTLSCSVICICNLVTSSPTAPMALHKHISPYEKKKDEDQTQERCCQE